VSLLDRLLFLPGQAKLRPEGTATLKRVNTLLKGINDTSIRIEGHTDNVPIGQKLRAQFLTNWELSTARATTVLRYLVEEGGLGAEHLSAAGYAHTKPISTNDTPEGRAANRRLEIVLIPRNTTFLASHVQP
jgi:chemotaxis protein MotB